MRPYFEIMDGKDYSMIYSHKQSNNLKFIYKNYSKPVFLRDDDNTAILLKGDIFIRIKNKGSLTNSRICRFSFNTGFEGSRIELDKKQLDPDSIQKNKMFKDDFKLYIHMNPFCTKCTPSLKPSELCPKCIEVMKDEN